MRAYRESFPREDGRRGLTREELLRPMGEVNVEYAERFSHATVSRWESGGTRPTVARLKVFGKALNLSPSDMAGLMVMAAVAPDYQAALEVYYGESPVANVPRTIPVWDRRGLAAPSFSLLRNSGSLASGKCSACRVRVSRLSPANQQCGRPQGDDN